MRVHISHGLGFVRLISEHWSEANFWELASQFIDFLLEIDFSHLCGTFFDVLQRFIGALKYLKVLVDEQVKLGENNDDSDFHFRRN